MCTDMNGSQSLDNASKELSTNQRAPLMPQVRDQLPESSKLFKIFFIFRNSGPKIETFESFGGGETRKRLRDAIWVCVS